MSSLKFFLITIMVLMPCTTKSLNENKIIKNNLVSLVSIEEKQEKEENSNKIKKRVKLRPEKEVNNIYININKI